MSCGHEKGRGAHGQVCVPPCVRAVCVCTCVLCVLCGISKSRMTLLVCYAPLFPRNLGPFECANYSLSTSPGARLGRAPLPLAAGRPALGGTHSAVPAASTGRSPRPPTHDLALSRAVPPAPGTPASHTHLNGPDASSERLGSRRPQTSRCPSPARHHLAQLSIFSFAVGMSFLPTCPCPPARLRLPRGHCYV